MANVLDAVIPRLLSNGLLALRENAKTIAYVNREYSALAGSKGSTIDVPLPSPVPSQAVVPANIAPNPVDLTPSFVPIPLDEWQEAPFQMSDKDLKEADPTIFPMAASEAVKSLANFVDRFVLGLYPAFFGVAGIPGTTPFSSGTTTDGSQLRKVLNEQLAPLDDRTVILDPDAEASASDLRAFQDYGWNQSLAGIRDGTIDRKLGMAWQMNQNVLTHVAGTAAGHTTNGIQALGITTVVIQGGSGDFVAGDIIRFAGHDQTYSVQADATGPVTSITISPALRVAVPDSSALTYDGTHVVNLGIQRNAIAFVSRPLEAVDASLGVLSQSAVDPVSGLTLRVQAQYEHKRTRWSYDILFGAAVIRADLGARLYG